MKDNTNHETLTGIDRRHPVFLEAARLYRRGYCSVDAALSDAEGYRLILADDLADDVERFNARHRLKAVTEMLADVNRIARAQAGVASASDRAYTEWSELAGIVRECTDLPQLILDLGFDLTPVNRKRTDWNGPCPACGGVDRWQVFNRNGWRAWCRQCAWSADAIALVQSYVPGAEHFRDAVTFLTMRSGAA